MHLRLLVYATFITLLSCHIANSTKTLKNHNNIHAPTTKYSSISHKRNTTVSSKKTLIDITGSEFPETNYQQPEFFFDTKHDFGNFEHQEILKDSEVTAEDSNTVRGEQKSGSLDTKADEFSMPSHGGNEQESFDNDNLDTAAGENAIEKNAQSDTYSYDDDSSKYFVNPPPGKT